MRAAIGLAPLSSVAASCRLADSHHDPAADSSAGGDACRVSLRLLVLPPVIFLVLYRFPFAAPRNWRAERRSVHLTNLSLVALYGALAATLGSGPVATVLLAVMVPRASSVSGCCHYNITSTGPTGRDTRSGSRLTRRCVAASRYAVGRGARADGHLCRRNPLEHVGRCR